MAGNNDLFKGMTEDEIRDLFTAIRQLERRKKDSRRAARLLRQTIILVWKGRCAGCFAPAASILEIHHADPVHEHGGNDPRHMYPLCPNCHSYVHALRRTRGKAEKRQAVENEMEQVYEGDLELISFLRGIAETESTKEKIQKRVAQHAENEAQE